MSKNKEMPVLHRYEDETVIDTTYLADRRETEDHVIITELFQRVWKDPEGPKSEPQLSKCKYQKFLCINGELANQKATIEEAAKLGYVQYNCGRTNRGFSRSAVKPKVAPRCVLIKI